jgi:hypothetical protein
MKLLLLFYLPTLVLMGGVPISAEKAEISRAISNKDIVT